MVVARIIVDGTFASVVMRRTITAGLAGATVLVEYAPGIWDGLTKTVVFKGSETKDNITNETTIKIPGEVLKEPGKRLQVGFFGVDSDKKQIIPTIWADLGPIYPGADPSGDTSTDPSLPVWAQIADKVEKLSEEVDDLKQSGGPSTPGVPGADGEDGGYYTPAVTQLDEDTIQFDFTPSKEGMPAVSPVTVELPVGQGSGGNVDQSGLTTAQISALDGMFKIASFTADPTDAYAAFKTAFGITDSGEEEPDEPEVTLTSISVTYSGGDVTAGTAVDDLTGIVVTAHYSDGTSETVTGYTLSGTIAEGANTITVSYGGMTTTFTVTGTSTGTTDDYEVHNFSDYSWTNGGILENNVLKNYDNYSYSEYIPCEAGVSYEINASFNNPVGCVYDENDNFLGGLRGKLVFIGYNDAKKMRLNALTSNIPSAYFSRYAHDPSSPNHVFPEYKWTMGKYVNASGQFANMTSYAYSEYIPVESGKEILLRTNAPKFSIAFYNANKEFTRTVDAGATGQEVSINVTSNEQYFILNASSSGCGSKELYWKYAE